jgi:alanyl-tRNA synthetase
VGQGNLPHILYKNNKILDKIIMKIETKDYYWECGDGCCSEYGTILFIDGKEIEDRRFGDTRDAYLYVLEEMLGHEVDYIYEDE